MITTLVLVAGAFVAALAVAAGLVWATWLTRRMGQGFLAWVMPIVLLLGATSVLMLPRDVNQDLNVDELFDPVLPPALLMFSRLASLFFLGASIERIVSMTAATLSGETGDRRFPGGLLAGFVALWVGGVLAPALFGEVPEFSQRYLYTFFIGCAALTLGYRESVYAVARVRDAMMLFLLASLLFIPVLPLGVTLQTNYTEGLIRNLPRLHGLASHAVQLGQLALFGLLCLITFPYRRLWLQVAAVMLTLSVLFMAQSKTVWLAIVLCCGVVFAVRVAPAVRASWGTRRGATWLGLGLTAIAATYFIGTILLAVGSIGEAVDRLLASEHGASLTTLTNRDIIWAAALQEWSRNPAFGYGPTAFDAAYRIGIGIPSATNGHNQLMDTLARSGTVGAVALVIYAFTLLWYAIRYAAASRGLTLGLFTMIFLIALTESPLGLFELAPGSVIHFVLLMVVAGCHGQARFKSRPTSALGPHRPAVYAES